MLKQKKINKWGCLPTAFASVIDMPIEEFYEKLGHDGSEKLDKQPDPFCRRGIHTQEVVDSLLTLGFAVTQIDCMPSLERRGENFPIFNQEQSTDRLIKYLGSSQGVLIGSAISDIFKRHALANYFGEIYDPDVGKRLPALPHTYVYESYYRVDKIK